MPKRLRKLAMAAGLAVTPLLLLVQQPAGAAETVAVKSGFLEFIAFDGRSIRCDALVDAAHNTDDANAPVLSWSTESTGGSDCGGFFKIIATYKDEGGKSRSVRYTGSAPSFGGVDGAYSPTSVTLEIDFTACDPETNDACTLSLTASPK